MPSKLGIHAIFPGQTVGVARALAQAGARMLTVKAVDAIDWLKEIKTVSPETLTMGRFTRGVNDTLVENPPLDGDLRSRARELMDHSMTRWDPHRDYVDYWEIINEHDPAGAEGHRKLAELMRYCMEIADTEGYKVGLFSWSLGVPEYDEFEAIFATGVFKHAKQHGHVLALHEYAWPMNKWYGESLPGYPTYPDRGPLACRYRWWYEDFLKPNDQVIPLYITETNLDTDLRSVDTDIWMQQMAWYDAELRKDPYVVGAHIFTLGDVGSGWAGFNFNRMLVKLAQHIIGLKDVEDPVWSEGHPDNDLVVPADYPHHYLLLPPDATSRWFLACTGYWTHFRVTIGTRLEEALHGPRSSGCAVTVVNPAAWEQDVAAFFTEHGPDIKYDAIEADGPLILAHILDARANNNQRFG
ncbi:MAG: hypothetical protein JXB35_07245 [Anaerolineae bacterium]|nr:hypothetical protein [Anaerolineae bacterium]